MAKYSSVPLGNTDITGGFWAYRQKLNADVSVRSVRDRFLETGRFEAFKCRWREGEPNKPHIFFDSDIAKWMEAVAYLRLKQPVDEYEALVEEIIDDIERQQTADGYVNSYFNAIEPAKRWSERHSHELYCAGHLIEAAVAWKQATGRDRFEKIMCRYADYIYRVFVEEHSARFQTPGHEEIELALVKLYSSTGNRKYLELSRYFIDKRGNNTLDAEGGINEKYEFQYYAPVREMKTAEGHSVRAGYLYSAMADLAREYSDAELQAACETLFDNIVNRRMYLTGGVGSTHNGEAYTIDFDLPNETSYTETCASIALAYFANRMLLLDSKSKYADAVETVMYNGFLSSTSLDGRSFYYSNPMEIIMNRRRNEHAVTWSRDWLPAVKRVEVFSCSCCPPNINRFIAQLGEFMLSQSDDCVYLHQFFNAVTRAGDACIRVETDYPMDGVIRVRTERLNGRSFAVRIPGWCSSFELNVPYTMKNGYAVIPGNATADITLTLDMTPRLVESDCRVWDCVGKAAVMRGPVVYCLEGTDNPSPLTAIRIDPDTSFTCLPGGEFFFPKLQASGTVPEPGDGSLYRTFVRKERACTLTLIPYYAFANRGEDDMRVWIPVR